MALTHPERVEAVIVQDAVALNKGFEVSWKTRRAFWADRKDNQNALRTNLLSLPTTRARHVGNDPDGANVSRNMCGWYRLGKPTGSLSAASLNNFP